MEHHFLEMRSLIKTSLRFIMKFPGEERSLIKTYLRSLIKTDFMEQPSELTLFPVSNHGIGCVKCDKVAQNIS